MVFDIKNSNKHYLSRSGFGFGNDAGFTANYWYYSLLHT